ncbi:kinase-like domain-containing protein [Rhizophagus clarus]|uniref:Kinase-like domain-containing protein n=1 Tax=Rhizophagus clarus TaxID=94130 RepID=A0A8H3KXR2_9GLOM|nr:kinase-like domain-containing protein [Rhizophagus clarus]
MSDIRGELVYAALDRSIISTDFDIYDDIHKRHEFQKQIILADKSLTNDEKTDAIKKINKTYDKNKIRRNEGTRRVCENSVWIDGHYIEWDFKEQKLIRFGEQKVVLKGLENVESANQRWFEEAKSHFNISNKWPQIVQCYGLTQSPSNGNYMLVIDIMNTDLRKYLQQNQLTWKERINIAYNISVALRAIHREGAIHRDLHSGNILYSQLKQKWVISDLGFCGPADKSSDSIYGNLPYIAPEVISGKNTTIKSDIYSIAMLMWEISSGQPPFNEYENDYNLALKIINGMRPKVIEGTPLEYENLMKQCWDAAPSKRLSLGALFDGIYELRQSYQNTSNESTQLETNSNLKTNKTNITITNYTNSSKLSTSKIYQFKNLPEPRNATEEEQEAFHSKSYDCFNIPDNIDDFTNSSNQNYDTTSKTEMSKKLFNVFEKLQISSNNDKINYGKEIVEQQQINKYNVKIDDDDEIYDEKNFHSEEQDKSEIPDDGF